MKKEDLIKLGLDDATAQKVVDAFAETLKGYIPKARFDEVNDSKKQLEKDIASRDTQLEELKKSTGDAEALKKTITDLQTTNATEKANYEAKVKQMQIDAAIDKALVGAKAKNAKAVKALLDLEKAELDGDSVKGLGDQLKKLYEAEETKFLFETGSGEPDFTGVKPVDGGDKSKGTKNPWSKEHFNLTEQGRIITENPELAKQLMMKK